MSVARRIRYPPIVTRILLSCTTLILSAMYRIAQCSIFQIRRIRPSAKKRAGLKPRSWFIGFGLAALTLLTPPTPSAFLLPVAFHQHPTVTAVLPAMRNPYCAAMRGANPVAVNPDVPVAIPAVIAVDPDPTFMRRMVVNFDDGLRGRHANDDLRHSGGRNETDSKQQ